MRRVLRGGSWGDNSRLLRSACRVYGDPISRGIGIGIGFRVARTLFT